MNSSPLDRHAATPPELRERVRAEEEGVPFVVFRDDEGRQVLLELGPDRERLTIGRSRASDIALPWDERVSRAHAAFERVGDAWTVVDDGLSRNGTWLGTERITGRRRLSDGDVVRVGATTLAYCAADPTVSGRTLSSDGLAPADILTPAQRRVLVALCRPYRDTTFASPASNPDIARELSVSVEAVKTTMRALFEVFGIDGLPQNQKRASLAVQALRSGAITRRDL